MKNRRYHFGIALASLLFTTFSTAALADYELNDDFSDDGVVQTGIGTGDDSGYDMVVQDDGKIVVVGVTDNGADNDIALLRYDTDGDLDTDFGDEGIATFKIGSSDETGYALLLAGDEDGSMYVAGSTVDDDGDTDIVVLKVDGDGDLDTDFGDDGTGYMTFSVDDYDAVGYDLAFDLSGNLLIAGTLTATDDSTDTKAVVVRFTSEGELDTDFGDDGYRTIDTDDERTESYALAVESDGHILLAGLQEDSDDLKQAALFRTDSEGTIDTDYGDDGILAVDEDDGDSCFYGLTVLDSGAIMGVGYLVDNSRKNMLVAEYQSSGTVVSTFGTDGLGIYDLGNNSIAYSLVERSDASLLIAGEFQNVDDLDVVLLYVDNLGAVLSTSILESDATTASSTESSGEVLATALSTSDAVITDVSEADDVARKIVLASTSSDSVYLAGYSSDGSVEDVAVLSYQESSDDDADYGSGNSTNPPFFVGTLSVNNIQRTSAMSGGVITENDAYTCEEDDEDDCPTVVERGVVFSISQYPSYRSDDDDDSSTTSSDDDDDDDDDSSVFPDWVSSTAGANYIRYGQTSDGTSVGTFGSDMDSLSPDTTYYVRAYAVLSDDDDAQVLYGNQLSFTTDDACFIATAAYGSFLSPHVSVLRTFRDRYLKTNAFGRTFVALYYRMSPPVAEKISHSSALKLITRVLLLPFVLFSYFMVACTLPVKIVLILCCGSIFFIAKKYIPARSSKTV